MNKVLTNADLANELDVARMAKHKIIFTNGVFDILHVGHVRLLEKAASLGDILIVGLNTDKSAQKIKGKGRPLTPFNERAEILSSLDCVYAIVPMKEYDPRYLIKLIKPTIHVKGGDYTPETMIETSTVYANGGVVVIVPTVPSKSSSRIIQKIESLEGDSGN